mmetsp:Transcript_15534/g.34302  ORF Transcript_15534/g.34302 Transcript_15534/m.34302 type:complete len:432 (+) Transcript_15534:2503-3798(+)
MTTELLAATAMTGAFAGNAAIGGAGGATGAGALGMAGAAGFASTGAAEVGPALSKPSRRSRALIGLAGDATSSAATSATGARAEAAVPTAWGEAPSTPLRTDKREAAVGADSPAGLPSRPGPAREVGRAPPSLPSTLPPPAGKDGSSLSSPPAEEGRCRREHCCAESTITGRKAENSFFVPFTRSCRRFRFTASARKASLASSSSEEPRRQFHSRSSVSRQPAHRSGPTSSAPFSAKSAAATGAGTSSALLCSPRTASTTLTAVDRSSSCPSPSRRLAAAVRASSSSAMCTQPSGGPASSLALPTSRDSDTTPGAERSTPSLCALAAEKLKQTAPSVSTHRVHSVCSCSPPCGSCPSSEPCPPSRRCMRTCGAESTDGSAAAASKSTDISTVSWQRASSSCSRPASSDDPRLTFTRIPRTCCWGSSAGIAQ